MSDEEPQVTADLAKARRYLAMAGALLEPEPGSELGQHRMQLDEYGQLAAQVGAGYAQLALIAAHGPMPRLIQIPQDPALTAALRQAQALAEARPHDEPRATSGGFPYRQMPHDLCGSNSERQSVGDPGHCEDCASVGHLVAHPDFGCGDVGCYSDHEDERAETSR